MLSLAGRAILHTCGKYDITGVGLGLLIGVTLVMAGVYRGMVDDGKALLDNSGADLWVVQKDTLGPYAESSSLNDDTYRAILAMPGVAEAANITYLTMQVRKGARDVRAMVVGFAPGPLAAPPGGPGLLDSVIASQSTKAFVNAVLVTLKPGHAPEQVAESIRRWKRLTVYTRKQMEEILIGKLIATSAKQIGMFLAILAVVSAAIVAFIIYTLTMDKIREIAVLKLIGTRNRTIAAMIMQQALALGVIGFVVGKITATFSAPLFPKYVLLMPFDSIAGFFAVLAICVLASIVAIRMALKVDPAEAIGG